MAPFLIDGSRRFEPPPVYQLWWDMTQECSGGRGLLSKVRWYYVPDAQMLLVDGQRLEGYWTAPGNTIVLAEAALLKGSLVRHEMLHSLEAGAAHSRDAFLSRCGGVVICDGACAEEVEPLSPPNPALVRIEPGGLEIGVEIRPQPPSPAVHDGHFTMTVAARNPRSDSVVVLLPAPSDGGPAVSFEYRVEHPGGFLESSVRARDDGVTRFAPGETKRQVFDFRIVGADESTLDGGLRPGTYDLRGAYGGRWAPAVTVTIP